VNQQASSTDGMLHLRRPKRQVWTRPYVLGTRQVRVSAP
jgi:hypothetical protein